MKMHFIKSFNGLIHEPISEAERKSFTRYSLGDVITCQVNKPRNPLFHRKFFALLKITLDNQEYFHDTDELLYYLKMKAEHISWVTLPSGNELPIPKSISFSSMEEHDFSQFYSRCVGIIIKELLTGTNEIDLRIEVERIIGFI